MREIDFKEELQKRGAREFQIVALSSDQDRALAAITEAERRGVQSVIAYAITLYDDPAWVPKGQKFRPQSTNLSVDVVCPACGGDRFVVVTAEVDSLYGETYAPCAKCNSKADTSRWVGNERRVTVPR